MSTYQPFFTPSCSHPSPPPASKEDVNPLHRTCDTSGHLNLPPIHQFEPNFDSQRKSDYAPRHHYDYQHHNHPRPHCPPEAELGWRTLEVSSSPTYHYANHRQFSSPEFPSLASFPFEYPQSHFVPLPSVTSPVPLEANRSNSEATFNEIPSSSLELGHLSLRSSARNEAWTMPPLTLGPNDDGEWQFTSLRNQHSPPYDRSDDQQKPLLPLPSTSTSHYASINPPCSGNRLSQQETEQDRYATFCESFPSQPQRTSTFPVTHSTLPFIVNTTWQNHSCPDDMAPPAAATDHDLRPSLFSRHHIGHSLISPPRLRTIPPPRFNHSLYPPLTPTFVVRPSLDLLTSRMVKPKRKLPTPPRISGWIPPDQRPIPSFSPSHELIPRVSPDSIQARFSDKPCSSTLEYSIGDNMPTEDVTTWLPLHEVRNSDVGEIDTLLPQVQAQNTFAFGLQNTSQPPTALNPSSSHPPSRASGRPNQSFQYLPLQSRTTEPPTSSNTSFLSLCSRNSGTSRSRGLPRPFSSLASLPFTRPDSEPNPARGKAKVGSRPYTIGMGSARRTRIEHNLANSVGRKFICPECDEPFTRRNDLERHTRSKHTGETPFHCPGCGKGFSRKDKLDQHIEKVPVCKAIAPPREERVRRRVPKVEPAIFRYE
ncbi:uncharacterized protein IL334_006821 [Kwoniella shivajii]|uniref:C2H2-type domain-containing protein n=1 Tax=Kwoniella shivajii TaxID=564305 RepID=A0ABZ1D900_9TREE|nr:hypothetical protein IL334_006821 [Kwoniella shivajii]